MTRKRVTVIAFSVIAAQRGRHAGVTAGGVAPPSSSNFFISSAHVSRSYSSSPITSSTSRPRG